MTIDKMPTDEQKQRFALRLRAAMIVSNISRVALAERADVAVRTVDNWCRGATIPHNDKLAAISDILGVSPEYLLAVEGLDMSMLVLAIERLDGSLATVLSQIDWRLEEILQRLRELPPGANPS